MRLLLPFLLVSLALAQTEAPVEYLWPDAAPLQAGMEIGDRPSLTLYPVKDRNTGAAVVVCPGGGYGNLAFDHEGHQIARWLNSAGINAFILRYRHAPKYRHPTPAGDAARALRWVRHHAKRFQVDPARVGIWGFSAGGHLAATLSTRHDTGQPKASDPIEQQSSRPDFAILSYPVINCTENYQHSGSCRNLGGPALNDEMRVLFSNEKHVSASTPPTFLFHTNEDTAVPPENAIVYYLALRQHKIPAEMHIYERGRHGLGLAHMDAASSSWPDRLLHWLYTRGYLARQY
jgi:acetyl esterase/lipase